MNYTYRFLSHSLGQAQHALIELSSIQRKVFVERDERETFTVSYGNTTLVRAHADERIEIGMHGWYTQNSASIMNAVLPKDLSVRFMPWYDAKRRVLSHPQHLYAQVYGSGWSMLETGWNGVPLRTGGWLTLAPRSRGENPLYGPAEQPINLDETVRLNNRIDDAIDAYIESMRNWLDNARWQALGAAYQARRGVNILLTPEQIVNVLQTTELPVDLVLAATRFDSGATWERQVETVLFQQNLRELRNVLRFFFYWSCLTGPLQIGRKPRPRPQSFSEALTFDA